MKKMLDVKEFYTYISQVQNSYRPNNELSPRLNTSLPYDIVDKVDLKIVPDKTLISIRGVSFSADYQLRVDDSQEGRKINIWRNIGANGLVGPLESVVSLVDELTFEEGVISKENQFAMPYFRYKDDVVEKPTDMWMDVPLIIFVQYLK